MNASIYYFELNILALIIRIINKKKIILALLEILLLTLDQIHLQQYIRVLCLVLFNICIFVYLPFVDGLKFFVRLTRAFGIDYSSINKILHKR